MKELLYEYNVIKRGHFLLKSERHSEQYINKDVIYSNPRLFKTTIIKFISLIGDFMPYVDIITGPAVGGSLLALPISLHFNKIFIYPEKIGNSMVFRRGYDKLLNNKVVWIIEDIVTTGGSIEKTKKAIEDNNGTVYGISCICNRQDYPNIKSLINYNIKSYPKDDCPLCRKGIPLQNPKES